MIICINKERVDAQEANKMRVVLQADTTAEAATEPKTGETVQDVEDGAVFYAGSIMTCLQQNLHHEFCWRMGRVDSVTGGVKVYETY